MTAEEFEKLPHRVMTGANRGTAGTYGPPQQRALPVVRSRIHRLAYGIEGKAGVQRRAQQVADSGVVVTMLDHRVEAELKTMRIEAVRNLAQEAERVVWGDHRGDHERLTEQHPLRGLAQGLRRGNAPFEHSARFVVTATAHQAGHAQEGRGLHRRR